MILNSLLIVSRKRIEEPQQFESNEHRNQARSSLPLIFRFPHFVSNIAVFSMCESLLSLYSDLENRKNCKQLKVREDRDRKGLKNWFHLACPVSTVGARNRGYCVGSVQLLGSCDRPSSTVHERLRRKDV